MSTCLQTERGEVLQRVADTKDAFVVLLPWRGDTSFTLLRFIDRYGHTTFNRLQMDLFLQEWQRIFEKAETPESRDLLAQVRAMAERCQKEAHLYLKFIGD